MPRKPHPTPDDVLQPGDVPAHAMTVAEDQESQAIETEMAFVAARALGRLDALEFSEMVSARARVEVYLELKKNKAYRAIQVRDADGKLHRISDLEEFCERYLGKSARRLHQMATNYYLLGGDLFEASQRIGFRNADYAALKALPAEDQETIKFAMSPETDREQILDLMQEMAVRHASQKAELEARATEAEHTAAARDDVIGSKQEQISKLQVEVASAKRRQANFSDAEKRDYECAPLHDTINATMIALAQMEVQVARLTAEVASDIVGDECFNAVLVSIKRAIEIGDRYRLGIEQASLFIDVSSMEMRAAGLNPEALQ
jgi:hypothetical protein